MVAVDYFTRWPMVNKTNNSKVEEVTKFIDLIHKIIGTLKMIATDNGGAFKGNKLTEFLATSNITRLETCAYLPKTNGIVERVYKNIIDRLQVSSWRFETEPGATKRSYRSNFKAERRTSDPPAPCSYTCRWQLLSEPSSECRSVMA